MMLLTSESWARPSLVSHVPRGTSISGGWGAWPQNLPLKFVSLPQILSPKIRDEKYPTLCPLNFRYDPKICVEDLHEFSSALYSLVRFKVTSKQII